MTVIHPLLMFLLSSLHGLTGDWGVAVILLTAVIRLVMLPLSVVVAKQSVRMGSLAPQLDELAKRYAEEPAKWLESRKALLHAYGIRPSRSLWIAVLQAPAFFSLYRVLGSAQLAHVSTVLTPWIPTLTAVDPTHLLPFAVAVVAGLCALVQYVPKVANAKANVLVAAFAAVIVLWRAPLGVALYYLTSSLWGAVERWALGGYFRRRTVNAVV